MTYLWVKWQGSWNRSFVEEYDGSKHFPNVLTDTDGWIAWCYVIKKPKRDLNLQPSDSSHSLHSVKFAPHLKDPSTVFMCFFFPLMWRGGGRQRRRRRRATRRGRTRVEDVGVNAARERRQNWHTKVDDASFPGSTLPMSPLPPPYPSKRQKPWSTRPLKQGFLWLLTHCETPG